MKYFFGILIFALTVTSCGTTRANKSSKFTVINGVKDLEGYYLNRIKTDYYTRSILSCFNIGDYADFVTIVSENPNEIKLIYYNDSTKQEKSFKGEMKKNYFEIYFSKRQFVIPIIYSSSDIDRVRVGKTKDGKLLIRKYLNQSGNLLILAAGYNYEEPYIFSYSTEYKEYIPTQQNGLWGYTDSLGNNVIPAKFDFASIFEQNVARVKVDGKWGLINKQGEEITPIKYDKISLIDTLSTPSIFRVFIGEKIGILDIDGKELIPVIYDYIGYNFSSNPDILEAIRLGDKLGRATRTRVVIPAIYSEQVNFLEDRIVYKRNGKNYIADKDGYEYEAEGNLFLGFKAKLETKRKIQFEEQEIE